MTGLTVIDCPQGSPAWFQARMGIPTASEFATILASGRDGGASKTRATYMRKLAGEIITGEPMDNFVNAHMERGKVMEAEAREFYAFHHDVDPQPVGFIVNGRKGCSPDSLIGTDGMLEIKTKLPHLMVEVLERGSFPPAHFAQCQGALWVAEREWIDIAVYWPRMPRFVKRTTRDEAYIKKLADAVDAFNDELTEMVERIRGYEAPLISHGEMMKAVLEPLAESGPALDHTDHGGVPAFLDRRAPAGPTMFIA